MGIKMRSARVAFARRRWQVVGITAISCAAAHAQPGNPGPTTFVDMGNIGIGANVYRTGTVTQGGYVWFKITLTDTIDPTRNWLELDMSGPTTLTNPEMAVYDARANLIFANNDAGGSCGTANTGNAPALSLGGGSGLPLSRTFGTEWDGGRISTGSDGSSLGAGIYWVCVAAWNAAFVDPNPNWTASSTSILAGTVGLRVTTDNVPATVWNEAQNSIDAGALLDTAQVVTGRGPLTNILCTYNAASRDMFKLHVHDGATFSAFATVTGPDGGRSAVKLFLFDASGHGVWAINNNGGTTDTLLSRPSGAPPLAEGDYFLAISNNCGGFSTGGVDYGPAVPYTASDLPMWAFPPNNQSIVPNGTGAAGSLAYWGRQANCVNGNTSYANIALTGAEFIPSGPAPCVADVDDGTGTGSPDGGVTIDDLLYFLQRFADGC